MESPIALITGAAGGIGSQTAKMLDQRGYQLVLVDINQEGMDLLAATLQRPPLCINANLLLLEDIERIYETTMEKFGQLDLLVNNAGMVVVGEYEERSHELVEREIGPRPASQIQPGIHLVSQGQCSDQFIPSEFSVIIKGIPPEMWRGESKRILSIIVITSTIGKDVNIFLNPFITTRPAILNTFTKRRLIIITESWTI